MAFQTALKFWQDFDVLSLQRVLDDKAAEIAKRQDESDASVKRLVELSKEFKRSTTEDVRKKVSPLMKSFQSEIDSLTKRSSSAEAEFLTLYKKVIEIPDPVTLMEQALSQQQKLTSISDLNVENTKLRETLEEYNKEFAHVKNQEATINKLKTRIRELESSAVQRATSKADEIESRLMDTYSEKERELRGLMENYKRKTDEAQSRSSVLQSALESTQSELFELKNKQDELSSARSAEVDILATDLDRANQRVISAERQLENYRKQYESNQTVLNPANAKATLDTTELELELRAKEKEVSCLLEDVERLQDNLKQLRETSTRQIMLLESQLKESTQSLKRCEEKLTKQEDYEEIKKELGIMKSVEFSTSSHQYESPSQTASIGSGKPLEVLLLEKNRALVNETTSLKTELAELRDHFSSVQSQYTEALNTIQSQSNLIGQLEADLTRIKPYLTQQSELPQGQQQAGSEIMAEVIQNIHTEKSVPGNTTESLLNIVTSQRERFKQRNNELEAVNQQQKQTMNILQREMDTLRGDNVKLYEKIRFLQTYQGNDSIVSQYSTQYEAKLDPFSAFSVKERQRKYMQLSGPDKATLLLGRFILSNKVARMVAFCYTVLLHIIVMLVLARLINTADSQTVDLYAECAKQFTEHMHAFHRDDLLTGLPGADGGGVAGVG